MMLSSLKKIVKMGVNLWWELQLTIASLYRVVRMCRKVQIPYSSENYHRRLYILVNGPSLTNDIEYLYDFRDNDALCVNHMANSPLYSKIKPRYYAIIYPGFFLEEENKKGGIQTTIEHIVSLTDWEMELIIPSWVRRENYFVKRISQNKKIRVLYINCFDFRGFNCIKEILRNHQIVSFPCYNVLSASLFAGICLGYKEINILGADHNYHRDIRVDDNNYVIRSDPHFYDDKYEDIVLRWPDGRPITMHEQFQSLANAFHEYEEIADYANEKSVKIYNLTSASGIDAFEKKAKGTVSM